VDGVPGSIARYCLALPIVAGVAVALFVRPASGATTPSPTAPAPAQVRTIYLADCATCHGADGAGTVRGPSLLIAGRAGVDFYLSTGRMPLGSPTQAVQRHPPRYDPPTIAALIDYISHLPGFSGPDIPVVDTTNADIGDGGSLYRLNCAACHAWSGRGGALLYRPAPALGQATPTQIVEAMLVGPGNMPKFGPPAVSPPQRNDIAAYTQNITRHPNDAGGFALWHLGPLPEGGMAVFAGILLLLVLARYIGTRG
jgi:ubiquinol-cytochrome c reductase cytochrome c subunit